MQILSKCLCVCAVILESQSYDPSNYLHRALIRVAYKFAHEVHVYEILNKVITVIYHRLKCVSGFRYNLIIVG